MKPGYNFLIQPRFLRGYKTRQGWAIVAMGVLLVIGGLLTCWEGSIKPGVSAGVTMYLVLLPRVLLHTSRSELTEL